MDTDKLLLDNGFEVYKFAGKYRVFGWNHDMTTVLKALENKEFNTEQEAVDAAKNYTEKYN